MQETPHVQQAQTDEEKATPDIVQLLKDYITGRIELIRLSAIERTTVVVSSMITGTVIALCSLMAFIFASLTLGFFLGELLDSLAAGFGLVTLLYIIIAVVVSVMKKNVISKLLQDKMIRIIFDKKEKDGKEI